MINFKNGLTYDEYMKTGTNEDKLMNQEFYKNSPIHTESSTTLGDNTVNIAVFSMTRCKDAATVTPVLLELAQNNPNINIKFFDKAGNEDLLKDLIGEVRIPTILKLDSKNNIKGTFVEFPTKVRESLNKNMSNKESIVSDFRHNKYFSELKADLLTLLTP